MKRAFVKEKSCRGCGRKFKPYKSTDTVCSMTCAKNVKKSECVIKTRVDIYPLPDREKTGELKDKLQGIINELVRVIDKELTCISCHNSDTPQAGHFHSVGSHPYLRFNLNNIHVQNHHCNIDLSGNKEQYFKGLCERYGHGYASWVENIIPARYRDIKLSKDDLRQAISRAREGLNELKNRESPIESMQERQSLRLIYNNRIGIYKTY